VLLVEKWFISMLKIKDLFQVRCFIHWSVKPKLA